MLNTMKSWLDHEDSNHENPELKLAIAKLMIGMMMADEHLDEFEYAEIMSFLTTSCDLTSDESKALIEQVKAADNDKSVFDKAAKQIVNAFTIEERAYILSIVWRIALVDDEVTFHEEKYLNRLATLFEVPASTLDALKKEQERDFPDLDERDRYLEF